MRRPTAPHVALARRLAHDLGRGLVFFDGGRSRLFLCPTAILTERAGAFVDAVSGDAVAEPMAWLRDFGGGCPTERFLAGYLGFEFAWWLDEVRAPRPASRTPALWVGAYDAALSWDEEAGQWSWEGAPDDEARRAVEAALSVVEAETDVDAPADEPRGGPVRLDVSAQRYRANAARCVDAIFAGELFEVNYTERFEMPWPHPGFALYEGLRARSTGEFFGYLDAGEVQLASVSPELFLRIDADGRVLTKPIKGTRKQTGVAEEDAHAIEELRTSEKDRAENLMIVDLMRNDLTRVCAPKSVQATRLCEVETFAGVHHLVSSVEGRLAADVSAVDALLACFPPGSITGAPKLRSVELIAETEASARGPYTGTMFWAERGGALVSSVLIRTAVLKDGVARYGAGGAIVADSDPQAEYEEALVKAGAFLGLES